MNGNNTISSNRRTTQFADIQFHNRDENSRGSKSKITGSYQGSLLGGMNTVKNIHQFKTQAVQSRKTSGKKHRMQTANLYTNYTIDNENVNSVALSENLMNRTVDELNERKMQSSAKMLPSNFRRTSTIQCPDLDKSLNTVGPADYDKERIIGNESLREFRKQP